MNVKYGEVMNVEDIVTSHGGATVSTKLMSREELLLIALLREQIDSEETALNILADETMIVSMNKDGEVVIESASDWGESILPCRVVPGRRAKKQKMWSDNKFYYSGLELSVMDRMRTRRDPDNTLTFSLTKKQRSAVERWSEIIKDELDDDEQKRLRSIKRQKYYMK